jgi:hypothetical protein
MTKATRICNQSKDIAHLLGFLNKNNSLSTLMGSFFPFKQAYDGINRNMLFEIINYFGICTKLV